MPRNTLPGALILLATSAVFAQTTPAPAPLEFEVASIKPAQASKDGRMMSGIRHDPGMVRMESVPLGLLITQAFQVKNYQLSGPDWITAMSSQDRYDINAKLPAGAKTSDVPAMLQKLLTDRFHLQLHRESRVLPVYALVVGKDGLKLQPVEAGQLRMRMGFGHLNAEKSTFAQLAGALSDTVDRPVIDATGDTRSFDITLDWTPDESQHGGMRFVTAGPGGPGGAPIEVKAPEPVDAPPIFDAIQAKLGLKLEPRKEPVEILVIDHAEKLPTDN